MAKNKKISITDELLAAYLEGNTTPEETMQVINAMEHDEKLKEILITAERVDVLMENAESYYTLLPMEQLAAKEKDNLCDFQCEEFLLGKLGIAFDSKTLSEEARFNKWLNDKGTPLHNVGRILEHTGLSVVRRYNATVADIKLALQNDMQVIVVVNADEIETCTVNTNIIITYHAMVVQNIDIEDNSITVFDPATTNSIDLYPLDLFIDAWSYALYYMVCASVKNYTSSYDPHPIELDDIELTDDLIELREAIAENAHDVWAAGRMKEGWTYGPYRNDVHKETPDLVPYSDLPDSERQYDRDMAMSTIKLVRKLGYDLIKGEDTEVYRSLISKIQQHESFKCKDCGAPIFKDQVYCEQCGRKLMYTDFVE